MMYVGLFILFVSDESAVCVMKIAGNLIICVQMWQAVFSIVSNKFAISMHLSYGTFPWRLCRYNLHMYHMDKFYNVTFPRITKIQKVIKHMHCQTCRTFSPSLFCLSCKSDHVIFGSATWQTRTISHRNNHDNNPWYIQKGSVAIKNDTPGNNFCRCQPE